jgi:hypothetical protein
LLGSEEDYKRRVFKIKRFLGLLDRQKEAQLAKFLQRFVPKGLVGAEIGVFKGQFTPTILNVTEPAKLHLIDPWYLLCKEWP